MPSFSRNLEQSLHRALAIANERRHEYATLEHLLLSLRPAPSSATPAAPEQPEEGLAVPPVAAGEP